MSDDFEKQASEIVSQLSQALTDRGLYVGPIRIDDGRTLLMHTPLKDEWRTIIESGLRRAYLGDDPQAFTVGGIAEEPIEFPEIGEQEDDA